MKGLKLPLGAVLQKSAANEPWSVTRKASSSKARLLQISFFFTFKHVTLLKQLHAKTEVIEQE